MKTIELSKNPIYLISSIRLVDLKLRSRTWGFYYEFDIAEDMVKNNATDLNESGYYPWVAIELMRPGLLYIPDIDETVFYGWQKETEKYFRLNCIPEKLDKYFDGENEHDARFLKTFSWI